MERLANILSSIYDTFGPGMIVPILIIGGAGVLGQWSLYLKCKLPGVSCVVPVWNVIVFLKIMGRPPWQSLIVMLPPPIIASLLLWDPYHISSLIIAGVLTAVFVYFMVVLYIELCNCFGQYKTYQYVLCLLLNGLYVLHLALSTEIDYKGPVHGDRDSHVEHPEHGQLAS